MCVSVVVKNKPSKIKSHTLVPHRLRLRAPCGRLPPGVTAAEVHADDQDDVHHDPPKASAESKVSAAPEDKVPAPPVEPKVSAAPVTDQPVTDQPVYKEPLATTILANAVVHLEAVMESMSKRVDPVDPVGAVGAVDPVDRADPAVVPKASAEKRKADKKPAAVQEMDKKPAAVQEMGMEFDPDCDSDGDSSHRSQRKRHATNRLGFGSQKASSSSSSSSDDPTILKVKMNGKGLKPPPTLPLGET